MNHRFESVPHGIQLGMRGFVYGLAVSVVQAMFNKNHWSYVPRMLKEGHEFKPIQVT